MRKAAIESSQRVILMQHLNFLKKVNGWVNVRSKVKADSFGLIGCQNQTRDG